MIKSKFLLTMTEKSSLNSSPSYYKKQYMYQEIIKNSYILLSRKFWKISILEMIIKIISQHTKLLINSIKQLDKDLYNKLNKTKRIKGKIM